MKKIATFLILFFGVTFTASAVTTLGINGLPATVQVGDTIVAYASGGTAPYSWISYNPGAIMVTQLDSNSARIIVVSSAASITIQIDDILSNTGNQIVHSFDFQTRIGNASFISGDTVTIPIYYSNKVSSVDLLSADISLPYDTTVFKFIGYSKAGTLSNPMTVISNQVYDTIKFGIAGVTPIGITNEQIFLMLRFVSKNMVASSVSQQLHFTKFIVNEVIQGAFLDGNITVDPVPNYPPVFVAYPPDTTIKEGDVYSKTIFASDANGHTVHYFLTMNPAPVNEAILDSTTGQFTFMPSFTSANEYVFQVTANDGNGMTTQRQFTITVNNVNLPPVFPPMFPDTIFIKEGIPFSLGIIANDPDISPVHFSLNNFPSGMTIDSVSGQLDWTPSFSSAGIHSGVIIEAHDGFGGSVTHSQIFAVIDSNRAPVFSVVPNDTTIVEGQSYFSSIHANDPDGDGVRYFVQSGQPPLFLLDSVSGAISWTPDNSLAGIYTITIVATDHKSYGTSTHVFTITVNNVNLSPVLITPLPDTIYMVETQNFSFTLHATDGDNDSLIYYAFPSPLPGMTVDSLTGHIQWTPDLTQAGTYSTTFKAKDPFGAYDYKYVVFVVFNFNQSPIFTSVLPDTTISENQLLTFTYTASDPDADTLAFVPLRFIPGVSFLSTGEFQWQPSYLQAGIDTVIVLVSDGHGGIAIDTAVITITNVNNPPMFTTIMHDTSIARFDTLRFHYTGIDPDSQAVTFSLLMFPPGATISTVGDLEWSPPVNANGFYNFIVRMTDGVSFINDTVVVKVIRFGDVSGNGTITSFDAGMILRDQVAAIVLDPLQVRVGNVSGDSSITSMDASLILQYVVGLINTFPGGLGKSSQQNAVMSAFSFKILPAQTAGDYDLFVSVNKPSQVFGITMSLRFDSSLIVAKSMKQTELSDSMAMSYFFPKGKANIALAGTKPLNTPGDIAKFTFTLKNPNIARDAVLFTMDKFVLNEKEYANEIGGIALSVENTAAIPTVFGLDQNYPNPFNPATTIKYQLPNDSKVTMSVYNLLGQLVTTLVNNEQSAGYHSIKWNGVDSYNRTVSSGVYLYKIVAQSQGKNMFVETKKMMLLK